MLISFTSAGQQRKLFAKWRNQRQVLLVTLFFQLSTYADTLLVHLTLKLCWKDVNKEFEEKLEVFRSHVKSVEKEAGMSSMIETHEGWAVAESERKRESWVLLLFHYAINFSSVKRRDQLLSCLSEIRYTSKHQSERKKRHPGTGLWLAKTVEFKDWEAGTRSHCLWCYGIRRLQKQKNPRQKSQES